MKGWIGREMSYPMGGEGCCWDVVRREEVRDRQ
jgi:hypothetical protein